MNLFSRSSTEVPKRRQDVVRQPAKVEEPSFRRNKTLIGSLSSQVQSTAEDKGQLKSARVEAHTLARHRNRLGALLIVAIAGAVIIALIISQFTARVYVTVAGSITEQPKQPYDQAIQAYLSERPAERLRFAMDSANLSTYLQAIYPEIEHARIEGFSGFATSRIDLTMRRPVVGWTIDGEQRYVDAQGVAFTTNYSDTPLVQIVDNSGIRTSSGQAIASNRFLSFIGQTVAAGASKGLTINQVVLPERTTRQIELHIKDVPSIIKLSTDRVVEEQVTDVANAIAYFQAPGRSFPAYLDVRVAGKAYYK